MIRSFTGEYEFLSNYYDPCPVTYGGLTYRNSEAAYQAQKCRHLGSRGMFSRLSPDEAKRLGKRVPVVDRWDERKAEIMREVVHAKFEQHPELTARLIATGNEYLVEGNLWHDNFFGDCECPKCRSKEGQNWLGLILMEERAYRISEV